MSVVVVVDVVVDVVERTTNASLALLMSVVVVVDVVAHVGLTTNAFFQDVLYCR